MSEKKLSILKVQRAVLIDQQERTKEFLEKESATASLSALELRLCHVEKQMLNFLDIQSQIEMIKDDELKESTRATYEEVYFTQQPELSSLIQKYKSSVKEPQSERDSTCSRNNVCLPKINLPTFNGNVMQWSNYFETFRILIHEEPSLSNLHKYQYLKSTLTGSAAAQIAALELNEDNYEVALDLLKNKYGDKRIICQAHIENLLHIKPLTANKPEHIRNVVDNISVQLRALEALGRPVKQWDDVLVHLISQKLDATLRSSWEDKAPELRLPTLQELLTFLTKKAEKIETTRKTQNNSAMTSAVKSHKFVNTALLTLKHRHCPLCQRNGHVINKCRTFINMSLTDRLNKIQELRLCSNCLRVHNNEECKSLYTCKICKASHHTLIHSDKNKAKGNASFNLSQPSTSRESNQTSLHSSQHPLNKTSYVFMPTALINVKDIRGNIIPCRAILDSASQLNFVSERLVQRLGLRKRKTSAIINGIGNNSTLTSNYQTHLNIFSRYNNFSAELDAVILPNITTLQPSSAFNISTWNIPRNIQLSDPEFYKPNRIDLLIGAELHYQLLQVGQIALGENLPILQKTILGWVIAGSTSSNLGSQYSCNLVSTTSQGIDNESLSEVLKKFWEIENHVSVMPSRSNEEKLCEIHFNEHFKRNSSGRIIVRIPFRQNPSCLGDSLQMATRRFLNLERRLHKDEALLSSYKNFIHEYIRLKHMRKLEDSELRSIRYVLPHHCVIKPESSSTKLRVVFDASAKSTTNYSLNDIMMIGPVVQQELFSIILRFRRHAIAITADICKMYRQVLVDSEDCIYQNIVWRDNPSQRLQYYQLQTVTYGTAAAPFLATRSLLQLALDAETSHSIGSAIIKSDFYVDDMITGSETLQEAREIRRQIEEILRSGELELRKWCSNNMEFLSEIPDEYREQSIQFRDSDAVKTLGLSWQPQPDQFSFKITLSDKGRQKITKRTILADIGSLFDPLGLINPVIVLGKIFMQQLWKLKLNWDESLPLEFNTSWLKYRSQLHLLESFHIPRRMYPPNQIADVQLHAFADASERAYGCCLYLRCVDVFQNISVNLVCAKSRVAPIKHTTIPRLELCAAQLMTQLVARVTAILNISADHLFYWTDSKIVLAWLAEPSSNWSTFVANRVANIQELSSVTSWCHVEGENNPADLVSRGSLPEDLLNSKIWLNGPHFLHEHQSNWKNSRIHPSIQEATLPERRKIKMAFIASEERDIVQTCKYVNSYIKLQNTFVYIRRFIKYLRMPSQLRQNGIIRPDERYDALVTIVKIVQQAAFVEDYRSLVKSGQVTKSSRLRTLCPFLDSDSIIRVGGRIENANIPYNAKHPMLIPSAHPFTKTLMTYLHCKNMHAGPQALLALTRQEFWPIKGGNLAKQIVHSCIRCFRTKPKNIHQMMGNLPAERVQPSRPFVNSGIDFCGPFFIHFKIRGKQPIKTYIAIFICFASKAVHLELASDLTSSAFVAALRRFIGRRGLCANLYCDNATNFIGANSNLKELRELFLNDEKRKEIIDLCSRDFISFHFIPPRSSHFGGLWEAAVKSAKYHLRRVVQGHSMTYEELNTFVVQVESILNSRPIQAISSDPNDLAALTPGHLLIGEPLTAVIEPNLKELNFNVLNRWQRIQWARQQFWDRWSKSYLSQLQCRNKWNTPKANITVDSLVLIKEDNIPPMKWVLGRVADVHAGDDGKIRVVSVKTANGLIKRSVVKLCPLPVTINN